MSGFDSRGRCSPLSRARFAFVGSLSRFLIDGKRKRPPVRAGARVSARLVARLRDAASIQIEPAKGDPRFEDIPFFYMLLDVGIERVRRPHDWAD